MYSSLYRLSPFEELRERFMAIGSILLIILGALVLFTIYVYNRLIRLKVQINNAWSQIDVQLKRRYDLIPNLVEAVKGYMQHERGVLENVTKARAQLVTGSPQEKAQASDLVTGALKSIFAVAENYPELKANQNFMMLQEELSGTESKIAYARQFYNDTVMYFNEAIQTFPNNILAGIFKYTEREYFKTEGAERDAVKVKF